MLNLNYKDIFLLGWPVLSVLLVFSVVAGAVALQCWSLTRLVRGVLAGARPATERAHVPFYLDLVEKRLALLGTIATSAPFVGLLGTVMGIIRAFHQISLNTGGGVASVAGGISEALVATAAGLAVAIPSSMAYNFYTYHVQKLAKDAGHVL